MWHSLSERVYISRAPWGERSSRYVPQFVPVGSHTLLLIHLSLSCPMDMNVFSLLGRQTAVASLDMSFYLTMSVSEYKLHSLCNACGGHPCKSTVTDSFKTRPAISCSRCISSHSLRLIPQRRRSPMENISPAWHIHLFIRAYVDGKPLWEMWSDKTDVCATENMPERRRCGLLGNVTREIIFVRVKKRERSALFHPDTDVQNGIVPKDGYLR